MVVPSFSVFAPVLQQHNVAEGSADDQKETDEQEPVVSGPTEEVGQAEQDDSETEGGEAQMGLDGIL